jgi:hypothetical protein
MSNDARHRRNAPALARTRRDERAHGMRTVERDGLDVTVDDTVRVHSSTGCGQWPRVGHRGSGITRGHGRL